MHYQNNPIITDSLKYNGVILEQIFQSLCDERDENGPKKGKEEMVPRGGDSSPCKHHTYTVFEAMLRISLVMRHVKCITLVYPVFYPHSNLRVME